MTALVVEIRDSHHRLQGYHQVDAFPLSIGRAYSNQIILSDPYVQAQHLVVNADEQGWRVNDVSGQLGKETRQLASGDEIVVGRTYLRFFSPEHPVAPAKSLHAKASFMEALRVVSLTSLLLGLLMLGLAITDYMTATQEVFAGRLVAATLPILAGVIIWSAIWSLLAYIARRRLCFYYFLTVAVIYVLADLSFETLIDYFAFNIVSLWMSQALSYVTGGVLLVALFYASMHRAFAISQRRKFLLANLFSWGLVLVTLFVVSANRAEFNRNPEFPAELKPPFARIASVTSLENFMADTEAVIDEIKIEE